MSFSELQRDGREFLAQVAHDPEALVGALLRKITDLEERLDDMMEANNLWSGR